jgi:hypothetical protein
LERTVFNGLDLILMLAVLPLAFLAQYASRRWAREHPAQRRIVVTRSGDEPLSRARAHDDLASA